MKFRIYTKVVLIVMLASLLTLFWHLNCYGDSSEPIKSDITITEEVAPESDEPVGTINCVVSGINTKHDEKIYDYWSDNSFMTVVLEDGTQFIYTNECTLTLPKQRDDE